LKHSKPLAVTDFLIRTMQLVVKKEKYIIILFSIIVTVTDGGRTAVIITNAGYGTATYHFSSRFSVTAEIMHSHIRSQQPGGLTDKQLEEDPQQSFRSRNWFDIKWTTPAIIANYQINASTRWNTKIFATIGDRSSVGFLQSITTADSINAATLQYNGRVVNVDQYRNYGFESRIITDYAIGKMKNTLAGGIRLYTGTTYRRADGKGTTGNEYTVSVTGNYPRDISFGSRNAAAFVENIFRVGKNLLIVPGVRYEWLEGNASGRNGYSTTGEEILLQNITRSRSFLLAGIGTEYHVTKSTEIYANYSQAYRPIQFANLQAPPSTDVVDPDLKDAKGYNIDLGYRGKIGGYLQFDLSTYYLQYNNRIGTITPAGANYRLITNVGASTSKGVETYAEFNVLRAFVKNSKADLSVFATYSYNDARYSGSHKDANTKGKKVENAPANIFRGGVSAAYNGIQLTVQVSYVDKTYSDANNTVAVSANAQNGLIPSYTLTDLTASWKFAKNFQCKAGINNLFNENYFTRRAGGYPGPGALPGDGRTMFLSIGAKF
jgi:Fe(3+) dicitrate transport protein